MPTGATLATGGTEAGEAADTPEPSVTTELTEPIPATMDTTTAITVATEEVPTTMASTTEAMATAAAFTTEATAEPMATDIMPTTTAFTTEVTGESINGLRSALQGIPPLAGDAGERDRRSRSQRLPKD